MTRPLRYVILRHEGVDPPHFDLMFEQAGTDKLATLRSSIWPIDRPVELVHLSDHRNEYLDYEGLVSGGRGSVKRVERGSHELLETAKGEWDLDLSYERGSHRLLLRCVFDPVERWHGQPRI